MSARPFLFGSVLLTLWATAACTSPDYIALEPTDVTLTSRSSMQAMRAEGRDHQGRVHSDVEIAWRIEDPEVATVDDEGVVRPVSTGRTHVVARAGDVEARAAVRVRLVSEVAFSEEEIVLSVSDRERYVPEIQAIDETGRAIEGRRFQLDRDGDAVSIDRGGGIRPIAPGESVVRATTDGRTGKLRVTVTE